MTTTSPDGPLPDETLTSPPSTSWMPLDALTRQWAVLGKQATTSQGLAAAGMALTAIAQEHQALCHRTLAAQARTSGPRATANVNARWMTLTRLWGVGEALLLRLKEGKTMQLVEQHVIDRNDPRYAIIDEAAFKSKNLYNAALYESRQAFVHQGIILRYEEMDTRMQPHEAYKALPAKVAQQVLKQVADAWKSFKEACKAYEADASKFTGRPKLPKYKHKTEGRNVLVYTIQAISRGKKGLQREIIKPSMLAITVKTQQKDIDQVRIVPHHGYYVVEVVTQESQCRPTSIPLSASLLISVSQTWRR